MGKKSEREPWASLTKAIQHSADSARACAGLNMAGYEECWSGESSADFSEDKWPESTTAAMLRKLEG